MVKNIIFRIAFISWIVFVTFSSLVSFSGIDTSGLNIPHLDKIVHFAFYFGMAFLGFFALKEHYKSILSLSEILWYSLLFSILYGIIIELIQYKFTATRHGEFWDALSNSFGAVVGITTVRLLFCGKGSLK